jgi:MYXO-CTERM domain-containing protein
MTEERNRTAVQFSYAANTTLTRAQTSTVKLGTTVGNTGLEGVTYDPVTGGYIFVNQAAGSGAAQNIFQTQINFGARTASNGAATTVNNTSLFPASNIGFSNLNDVFALANVYGSSVAGNQNLLVLTTTGIKEMTRSGTAVSSLALLSGFQVEGMTMDSNGLIYVVSDNGDVPTASALMVYAPAAVPEPEGYGLALAGLGALGFVARRRKS